ncbi:MAG: HisA/HisF-related TIM barrel protein [Candidatus Methanospirareceae archaeon]
MILAMDILDGKVVHARRGEREKYEPIHLFSSIVEDSAPLHVLEKLNPREVYIADLDRLLKRGDNKEVIKEMKKRNREVEIMLDYGIESERDLREVIDAADNIILGTETASLELIRRASASESNISVSVDLFGRKVVTKDKKMKIDPYLLIKELNNYRLKDIIVLELDRVGMKRGVDFSFLSRIVEISNHNILCGGGVRSCEDIYKMEEIGVKGAIVATAIYDGSIPISLLRR